MPAWSSPVWLSLSALCWPSADSTSEARFLSSALSHLQLDSLPQGADPSPKPLIIGPVEDYDPGYFNNEVTVSCFFSFHHSLSYSPLWTGTSPEGASGREHAYQVGTPGAELAQAAPSLCPQPCLCFCLPERRHIPGL